LRKNTLSAGGDYPPQKKRQGRLLVGEKHPHRELLCGEGTQPSVVFPPKESALCGQPFVVSVSTLHEKIRCTIWGAEGWFKKDVHNKNRKGD